MQSVPKVVLDTNIYISAFLTSGNARKIVEFATRRKIIVFSSPNIEEELSRVLKEKLEYDRSELTQALTTYKEIVHKNVYPNKRIKEIKRDETDNRILEAAIESNARYIISGDKHLLDLKKYKKVKIITPSEFIDEYEE